MNNLNGIDEVNNEQVFKKLFKEVYLASDNEKQAPDDVAKVTHFGNNKRKIFIGVSGNNNEILNANERSFLQKILAAIKLNEEDVFITSLGQIKQTVFSSFINNSTFEKFIFFGITLRNIDWHMELMPYQRAKFMEKEILFADTLPELIANETAKKKLWIQLQAIFNVK